jgi:hypothetical protein
LPNFGEGPCTCGADLQWHCGGPDLGAHCTLATLEGDCAASCGAPDGGLPGTGSPAWPCQPDPICGSDGHWRFDCKPRPPCADGTCAPGQWCVLYDYPVPVDPTDGGMPWSCVTPPNGCFTPSCGCVSSDPLVACKQLGFDGDTCVDTINGTITCYRL